MAKGYWIVHVEVTDPEGYKGYAALTPAAVGAFGGRMIVRGGTSQTVEGVLRPRHVVVEFPSYRAALDCYNSPDYQRAQAIRAACATADVVVIEGVEP